MKLNLVFGATGTESAVTVEAEDVMDALFGKTFGTEGLGLSAAFAVALPVEKALMARRLRQTWIGQGRFTVNGSRVVTAFRPA